MTTVVALGLLGVGIYGLMPKTRSPQVAELGVRAEAARQAQPEDSLHDAVLKLQNLKHFRSDIEGGRGGVPNYNTAWRGRSRLVW